MKMPLFMHLFTFTFTFVSRIMSLDIINEIRITMILVMYRSKLCIFQFIQSIYFLSVFLSIYLSTFVCVGAGVGLDFVSIISSLTYMDLIPVKWCFLATSIPLLNNY